MTPEKALPPALAQGVTNGDLGCFAKRLRTHVLRMVHRAHASHIGSCLSVADVLAVLYGAVLRVDPACPFWPGRDRLILSKGHAAAALYAALAECGFLQMSELDTYCSTGSRLLGHANHEVPGVELSTGSLGHGLPVGCGLALALQEQVPSPRVFVLMSDGEQDEGSVWEAALFAAHHSLDNIVGIVDANQLQGLGRVEEVLKLEPLTAKWNAFGWSCCEVNGHDIAQLRDALTSVPFRRGYPSLVIARTTKGRGVSFMENQFVWHYRSPTREELAQALAETGDVE